MVRQPKEIEAILEKANKLLFNKTDEQTIPLTKIEEIVLYLQNNKEKGFYGKIIESYEAGKKVNMKIEISIK